MAESLNWKILPFFIPMEGCRQNCIYCDQRAISGRARGPRAEEIAAAIAAWREESPPEVAFYGGSFSALSREKQSYYLAPATLALAKGQIRSIRISTRPDCLDNDRLDFLIQAGVNTIELGIQSFDDQVLLASKRGYDRKKALATCRLVHSRGLNLGIQLMPGLPGDKQSLASAQIAAALLPQSVRIYPTVVLKDTELAKAWQQGLYQPLNLAEAVRHCRDIWAVFEAAQIKTIRIGLNPLEDESKVLAGPYHPAFGHLVKSALKLEQIRHLLAGEPKDQVLNLLLPKQDLPRLMGHKQANWQDLMRDYPLLHRKTAKELQPGTVALKDGKILHWQEFAEIYAKKLYAR
ncbi:MAG: radical SAM protein [Clostridiales bacterium]|nr:radical SAM protein [Clostridiales bacterium]